MGYYIRLLSPSEAMPKLEELTKALERFNAVRLSVEDGDAGDWTQLLLSHGDETAIASIERNLVRSGELGAEEIAEFLDEISNHRPQSAVAWLQKYLRKVKCIYAFQILSGVDKDEGW